VKNRGETQFPEAGVRREGPTYAIYSGTQPGPIVTGVWRRKSADVIHEHAMSTQGRETRHRLRAEHEAGQERERQEIAAMRQRRRKS
jgi:hypothetical protein